MAILLYKHNEITYSNMRNLFQSHQRVAVVQPTGTGKSFLYLKWIEEHPEQRICVVSPSTYIFMQLKEYQAQAGVNLEKLVPVTYTRLALMEQDEIEHMALDFIVLDEFHRCGAQEWGRSVTTLLETHPNAKVLGTSATPVRYLDDCRDMAEELFDRTYAVNMSLAEAMADRILPTPKYIASYYELSGELERLQNRANYLGNERLRLAVSQKIKKIRRMLTDQSCGLPAIFKKHITRPQGRYLVFCSSEERLENAMKECEEWFAPLLNGNIRNLHRYKVLSTYRGSKADFEGFVSDNTPDAMKLLFCIDMLNEGVHVQDIDGVIMLRATESLNVYYQQLGRALACSRGKQEHPLIFDLVNNFENGMDAELAKDMVYELRNEFAETGSDIDFQVFDYILDIKEIMQEIRMAFSQSWEANFQALNEYLEMEGHFPARKEIACDLHLGDWCSVQRAQYKKGILPAERIKKLEAIGFSWDVLEDKWNTNYCALCQYVEKQGSLPRSCDNRPLYNWIKLQKTARQEGRLDENHEKKLRALGIELLNSHSDEVWEERFQTMKAFMQKEGRQPQANDVMDGIKIGTWLHEQRRKYANGSLTEDRKQRLIESGISFDTRGARSFEKNIELLNSYVKTHGRFPDTTENYEGFGLGAWCLRLRKQYESKELSDEQIQKIKELGFDFRTAREIRQAEKWKECYLDVKQYTTLKGALPKSRENPMLYRWMKRQQDKLAAGELSGDEKNRIRELLGVERRRTDGKRRAVWRRREIG
ncbi:MAG: Helicase associated domain protein [Hespellia sp.]|nr:Helicase associated domain protein [Hespellia sp.]